MQAGSLIMADTILAEPGWNFFWITPRTTHKEMGPSYLTLVRKLHHSKLKPKQVNEEVAAGCRLRDRVLYWVGRSGGS